MDVNFPKSGKYVVAVSGGVDSVVLLDVLRHHAGLELIVAHFDHGIRPDSSEDMKLVGKLAKNYELTYIYEEGKLGTQASEAVAREARYKFLRKVVNENSADGIITAHHQDDLLETAILNMLRGTGRKGLTSLASNSEIIRPLLNIPKQNLIKYAQQNNLDWHEDSTNQDVNYLRNYIRYEILPKFSQADKHHLLNSITNLRSANQEMDQILDEMINLELKDGLVKRAFFIQLPHNMSKEFMASWLRREGVREFDKLTIERLVIGAKTGSPGKSIEAVRGYKLSLSKDNLALKGPER